MDPWKKVDEEKANRHYGHEGKHDREYSGYYGDANAQEHLYSNRFGSERPNGAADNRNLDHDDHFIDSSYSNGMDANIGMEPGWGSGSNNTDTRMVDYGLDTGKGFNRRLHEKSAEAKSFAGKGPKDWKRSDERIKEEACEALTQDRDIDASEIEVEVKDGIIYLCGKVDNRYAKRLAEECVENIFGVQDVQNQLKAGHL